jgi:hypothetical protein
MRSILRYFSFDVWEENSLSYTTNINLLPLSMFLTCNQGVQTPPLPPPRKIYKSFGVVSTQFRVEKLSEDYETRSLLALLNTTLHVELNNKQLKNNAYILVGVLLV